MVGIGFFAPLPLAMMMPFMAGQSMLMGDAFGKAYQYGKRKISAMSNEEFNALTPEMLGKSIVTDYTAIIPSLQEAVRQSSEFQSIIIQEMGVILKSIPNELLKFFGLDVPEGPPGTVDKGQLVITAAQVASWSNAKLVVERTQNISRYTLLSQSIIVTAYNNRIPKEPPVHKHEPAHHPPGGVSIKMTATLASNLAQGRVVIQSNGKASLQSKINSQWVTLQGGDIQNMIRKAIASWPPISYTNFGISKIVYWVLKTKMPPKWHI